MKTFVLLYLVIERVLGTCIRVPCLDKISNCHEYDADLCTNVVYKLFRKDNCARFCGICADYTTETTCEDSTTTRRHTSTDKMTTRSTIVLPETTVGGTSRKSTNSSGRPSTNTLTTKNTIIPLGTTGSKEQNRSDDNNYNRMCLWDGSDIRSSRSCDINVGINSVNRENVVQEDTLGRNERIELYSKENDSEKEYQHSNPDSREGKYAYTNPVAYEDSKSTDKDGEIGLEVKSICEYGVCANNGTCSETETNFKCQCMKGYYGRVCEHMVCSNIICYNGGFCVINGSFGECLCPPGFYGSHCEDTPCDRPEVRCLNGGSCLFSSNTSTCACSYQYFGEACEKYCQYEHEDGCFLQNDLSDNFNWTRNTGTTPSKYTGPSSAFEGTYYLYIEASPPVQENNIARLISSQSLSTCLRCLKFSYHMYGTAVGSLNIYHGDQKLWTQSGSHGDMWNTLSLEVDGAVDKRIIFEAVRGSGVSGDIALDDIHFSPGGCK
ncbi:unnamed protein product [Mytilus edulis]|uniref:Uncharacterized protein n=1 Tax=Mytilus edulis TaxID=6550 RepID=A0A8S3TR81_MYTED|nr:unnamed protein product [Mytilus edulis]